MPERQQGTVTRQNDVVFGTGGGRDLRADLFLPPEPASGRAAVVLVHGGGWVNGDRSQLAFYGIQLARYGFVCMAVDYRLSGENTWPAQIHDVKAAIRWLRANADWYGIDESRIAAWGNSAGGHLVLMAAADTGGRLEGDGGNPEVSSRVAAIVSVYPPTRLRAFHPDDSVGRLLGGTDLEHLEEEASPLSYARRDFPPTMLIHGNADDVVPVEATLQMYDALSKVGAPVEMHVFQGQLHAFDTTKEYARQLADLAVLFLDRNL